MLKKLLFILFCLQMIAVECQTDFNNYGTLKCSGEIPDALKLHTYDRINQKIAEGNLPIKNDIDQLKYLTGVLYPYDSWLQSGWFVTGDPLSSHVRQIAEQLLESDRETFAKLHFYTSKSDVAGVRVSEFGDVFVSVGLLSQVSNDAQIAFLLAHELAHFVNGECKNVGSYSPNNKNCESFFTLDYNSDQEKKADQWALSLLSKSGFDRKSALRALDVLLYAFLPYEDASITAAYFVSDSIVMPLSAFPESAYPIGLDEKTLKKSQFSRINQRKIALQDLANLETDGREFITEKQEFSEISNIARFESVRGQLLERNPGKALYTIFLLERKFPKSAFLQRMKAICWTTVAEAVGSGEMKNLLPAKLEWQGEVAKVYFFLSRISYDFAAALELSEIDHYRSEYPSDPEAVALFDFSARTLGYSTNFSLKQFQSGLQTEVETEKPEMSTKYDKIHQDRTGRKITNDSLRFVYGLIPEIVNDQRFLENYRAGRNAYLAQIGSADSLKLLPPAKRVRAMQQSKYDQLRIGLSSAILFQPRVKHYSTLGLDQVRSEFMEKNVQDAFLLASENAGIKINIPAGGTEDSLSLEEANERIVLLSRLDQIQRFKNVATFPVDYQEISALIAKYGTDKLILNSTDNQYFVDFHEWFAALAITVFPIPILVTTYLPAVIMSGNSTKMWIGVYDLHSGLLTTEYTLINNIPAQKYNLSAELYIVMKYLQQNPK